MYFISKNTSLLILGVTSIVCARTMFLFFDDPEGPNLLIVMWASIIVFVVSLSVYAFSPATVGIKKLLLAILIQLVVVTSAYLLLK